jgi:hypothetical protein
MKTENTLLVELSRIQGQRLGKEIKLLRDMMDERSEINPSLQAIVYDNWDTNDEVNKRYFISGE